MAKNGEPGFGPFHQYEQPYGMSPRKALATGKNPFANETLTAPGLSSPGGGGSGRFDSYHTKTFKKRSAIKPGR